jgi:nitrile hydratase beta subunit
MNGVHDMGGMHGFGPVEREAHEPVFHHPWEAAVYAINRAMGQAGIRNIDESRYAIERMDPAEYLVSSYYERWLDSEIRSLLEKGVISAEELEQREAFFAERPDAPATAALSAPIPPPREPFTVRLPGYEREPAVPPRFAPGDRVLTRNTQPKGHTRLPRYARSKRGVIEFVHGTYVFPDSNALGLGEQPQPLYSVRFEASELWGDSAEPHQTVNLDLWESYLLAG